MRFFRIQFVLHRRSYSGVPNGIDTGRLAEFMDFTKPSSWYPNARRLKRKIICHVGPTNSGKTFSAMQSFLAKSHINGIYCAPLRLLAIEAYNKLNKDYKIPCALRTGEISAGPLVDEASSGNEVMNWQDAPVLSCTVEMVNINRIFDVAVIDEIQMMADPQRGWAFTQAFLGLQAKEIYLCGEEAALPLVEAIAKETGDEIEVKHFKRLSPLAIAEKSLDDSLSQIRPGDCLVTFSRRQIFDLKAQVERRTNMKCAVVYGNLPMGIMIHKRNSLFNFG
jgi:ATP-dependent RNA helicase SUPV3L1/SUV3